VISLPTEERYGRLCAEQQKKDESCSAVSSFPFMKESVYIANVTEFCQN